MGFFLFGDILHCVCVCVHSEDYYGDLDLKSIRKSELLAGLSSSSSHKSKTNTAAAPKTKQQPRPTANARPNQDQA